MAICGLRAFWPISSRDEVPTIYDLSGQSRHLLTSGSVGFTKLNNTGVSICGLYGDGGYLYRASEAGLAPSSQITLGAWVYVTNFGYVSGTEYTTIMARANTAAADSSYWIDIVHNGTTPYFRFGIADGGNWYYVTSTTGLVTRRWYFVLGVYTSYPTYRLHIWVDDVLTTNSTSIPGSMNTGALPLRFGQNSAGGGRFFNGWFGYPFISAEPFNNITADGAGSLYQVTRGAFDA
jgi:hypothetical protein